MSMGKKHHNINYLKKYQSTKGEENEEDNNCKNSLFFGLFDDPESTRLRSGSMKRQYSDMGDSYHRVYDEQNGDVDYDGNGDEDDGSRMDMRVLMVLEYMRELYVGQLQLLKKMFPGAAKDEFLGFFNKIGDAVSQFKQDSRPPTKSMTMQRSLSTGSPRVTSKGVNLGSSDLRDERFKVTTVNAGGAGGTAGGGKGGSAAGQGQTKK